MLDTRIAEDYFYFILSIKVVDIHSIEMSVACQS